MAIRNALANFLRLESAGGILLVLAAAVAIIMANTPLDALYQQFLDLPVEVAVGEVELRKPLLLWVNDGLMAIFFLLVGLEIKREVLEGELSSKDQIVLPAVAALGGFVVPALIYVFINRDGGDTLNGWAIPAATDIAFALGVLSLLGSRVPLALKVFVTTLAIVDDLMAIIVIAIFYSQDLNLSALSFAFVGWIVLFAMNLMGVTRVSAYLVIGVIIWVAVVKSGVHATLNGVMVALAIPLRAEDQDGHSPARHLEHTLHPWVAFFILPLFAFANAGVSFAGMGFRDLGQPVTLGIIAGLFIGKQIGVFGLSWLAIKLGFSRLPAGATWPMLYGAAMLTGIGFTMSLFIGTLAFEHGEFDYSAAVRLGVLVGSLLSAVGGYLIIRMTSPEAPVSGTPAPASG
jgi:NhaA family Na+:H+ antiporter